MRICTRPKCVTRGSTFHGKRNIRMLNQSSRLTNSYNFSILSVSSLRKHRCIKSALVANQQGVFQKSFSLYGDSSGKTNLIKTRFYTSHPGGCLLDKCLVPALHSWMLYSCRKQGSLFITMTPWFAISTNSMFQWAACRLPLLQRTCESFCKNRKLLSGSSCKYPRFHLAIHCKQILKHLKTDLEQPGFRLHMPFRYLLFVQFSTFWKQSNVMQTSPVASTCEFPFALLLG